MTSKVRVAIAGVGNCSSSLIQGVHYYRDAKPEDTHPGPDARGPGRLPRQRPRVRGRVRRGRRQGRQGPERGDLLRPKQHLQVLGRPAPGRDRAARPDAGRPGQVSAPGHHRVGGAAGGCGPGAARRQGRRADQLPAGGQRSRARASTPSRRWRPASASSTASRSSSPRIRRGGSASRTPACRSSATTSRARSAPRSPTAC